MCAIEIAPPFHHSPSLAEGAMGWVIASEHDMQARRFRQYADNMRRTLCMGIAPLLAPSLRSFLQQRKILPPPHLKNAEILGVMHILGQIFGKLRSGAQHRGMR